MAVAQQTKQLNSLIDANLATQLDRLKESTHVPKKVLLEKAIELLLEQYRSMTAIYKSGVVDQQFTSMVDETMKRYDKTMKKLAE